MPTQVEAISSWMSPWFQAKLWFVLAGMNTHASGVAHVAGVFEAKKNQSGSAKGVCVGDRIGSAVKQRSLLSVTGARGRRVVSAPAWPVYGPTRLSLPLPVSCLTS